MTNILWALLGVLIGGALGITVMAILQIGRDDREDKK